MRVSTANAYTVLEHFAHSTGDRRAWFSSRPFYAALSNALLETTTKRLRADPRAVLARSRRWWPRSTCWPRSSTPVCNAWRSAWARMDACQRRRMTCCTWWTPRWTTARPSGRIEQTIHYCANPLTGHAALAIAYVNRSSPGDTDGRLADYLRVYVPSGSRLTSTSGLADAQPARQVDGLTEFGGFLNLSGGGRQRVEFEYWLPPHLAARWSESGYALHVPKQPGTDGHRLVVETPQGVVFDGRLTTDVVVGARSQ